MATSNRSMELISKEEAGKKTKITHLDGRANIKRQELKNALAATDQEAAFKKIGDHGFEIQFEKGEMCNFPITLVRYWGEIPASADSSSDSSSDTSSEASISFESSSDSSPDPSKVPEETYMFFEPQWELNKKYLTHSFVNPEKKKLPSNRLLLQNPKNSHEM